jgi:hypothetical protein
MRVVAFRERPAIGFRGYRHEVGPIEIEELCKRGAVRLAAAGHEFHVARDQKSIEPQIHRERIARDRRSVAEDDAHVPVRADDKSVTVK